MDKQWAIAVDGLCYAYSAERKALHNVSFHVGSGETTGLVGPNGAGKTTFINMVTGYLKPSAGHIRFRGQEITGLAPREVTRAGICRSFQVAQLYSGLTVLDNMLIALGMLPEEMQRRGYARVAGEIKRGVDLAAELGADVVGLGAFTSIFSRQGAAVTGRGPAITTGNILTAAMAYRAIRQVADQQGLCIHDAKVGVVGARGSVGSLCAQLLARANPRSIILVGNSSTNKRHLERIHDRLRRHTDCPIETTTQLDAVRDCDVIVSATSSPFPVLDEVALRSGTGAGSAGARSGGAPSARTPPMSRSTAT